MLQILSELNKRNIVLASQSPRRKQILETIGLKFSVVPSTFPETLDKSLFTPVRAQRESVRPNAVCGSRPSQR